MKYKLFISDYDGTLGGAPANTIDNETLSAIREYEKKGGKFVICTGRMFSSIQRIAKSVGLKGNAVSFQGAVIRNIGSGEFLYEGGLSPEQAIKIVDEFNADKILPLIYIGETIYYEHVEKYSEYIKGYVNTLKTEPIEVLSLKDEIKKQNKNIYKACGLCESEKVEELVKKYSEKHKNSDIMFNSGANYLIEGINAKDNKGSAVEFLAKYYNIPLDQVITIGDSTNDIPLVDGEWHGVAVGDAKEQLKLKAKETTVPFNEKPVLHLLKKYCL